MSCFQCLQPRAWTAFEFIDHFSAFANHKSSGSLLPLLCDIYKISMINTVEARPMKMMWWELNAMDIKFCDKMCAPFSLAPYFPLLEMVTTDNSVIEFDWLFSTYMLRSTVYPFPCLLQSFKFIQNIVYISTSFISKLFKRYRWQCRVTISYTKFCTNLNESFETWSSLIVIAIYRSRHYLLILDCRNQCKNGIKYFRSFNNIIRLNVFESSLKNTQNFVLMQIVKKNYYNSFLIWIVIT